MLCVYRKHYPAGSNILNVINVRLASPFATRETTYRGQDNRRLSWCAGVQNSTRCAHPWIGSSRGTVRWLDFEQKFGQCRLVLGAGSYLCYRIVQPHIQSGTCRPWESMHLPSSAQQDPCVRCKCKAPPTSKCSELSQLSCHPKMASVVRTVIIIACTHDLAYNHEP